jgi:hypothetical protein
MTRLRDGRSGFDSRRDRRFISTLKRLASCSVGTGGFSSGVKRPGSEGTCSPLSSAKVKNEWSCTSSSPISLHGVDRNNRSFLCEIILKKYLFLIW